MFLKYRWQHSFVIRKFINIVENQAELNRIKREKQQEYANGKLIYKEIALQKQINEKSAPKRISQEPEELQHPIFQQAQNVPITSDKFRLPEIRAPLQRQEYQQQPSEY